MKSQKFISFFCVGFALLLISQGSVHAQTPTYRALMKLVLDENNNAYDPEEVQPIQDKNMIWWNLYFNYYKNPDWADTNGDEVMVLSLGIEYVIQIKIGPGFDSGFDFPRKTPKDIIKVIRISTYDPEDPDHSNKIKRKYYKLESKDSTFSLNIDDEVLNEGNVLKIYCKLESFYFRKFIPFGLFNIPNSDYIYSINQPGFARYSIPKDVSSETMEQSMGKLRLISFVDTSPPLRDYPVFSASIKSKLEDPADKGKVVFTLQSFSVPVFIGTNVENLIKYDGGNGTRQ